MLYPLVQRFEVIVGWILMRFGVEFRGVQWATYKGDLVANTDFRKFDGCLRLVLAGEEVQRRELEGYLEGLRQEGEAAYGLHVSRAALITCLIERRQGAHFHFVDAAEGGYALAARALKQSLEPPT
ncbi:MAG: DUF3095 family protein [Gemmatimonadetes bacterium]|nr:DUF3095 family protein [Gemmatimonadota bacterium]